jgi:hypothetical protein
MVLEKRAHNYSPRDKILTSTKKTFKSFDDLEKIQIKSHEKIDIRKKSLWSLD